MGGSRYANRLRQNIREVTQQAAVERRRQPVLIFGEPGLNKDNLAALIHFGSVNKTQPMIQVNCEKLRSQDLFGRGESQPGLLEWLGKGTLLLNNVQDLDDDLKPPILELIQTGHYRPVQRSGEAPLAVRTSPAWIMMVAERALPELSSGLCKAVVKQIKAPPLRVRKADIEAQINYFSQLLCRQRGLCKRRLDPAALRRLQSYDFPGNLTELESMVERPLASRTIERYSPKKSFGQKRAKSVAFGLTCCKAIPNFDSLC